MAEERQRSSEREQFWRQIVADHQSSGQSVREFCRARGVTEPNFYHWRRTLSERDRKSMKSLVPVRILADAVIEVVLPSGVIARIPVGVSATKIAEFVSVLASSC